MKYIPLLFLFLSLTYGCKNPSDCKYKISYPLQVIQFGDGKYAVKDLYTGDYYNEGILDFTILKYDATKYSDTCSLKEGLKKYNYKIVQP